MCGTMNVYNFSLEFVSVSIKDFSNLFIREIENYKELNENDKNLKHDKHFLHAYQSRHAEEYISELDCRSVEILQIEKQKSTSKSCVWYQMVYHTCNCCPRRKRECESEVVSYKINK